MSPRTTRTRFGCLAFSCLGGVGAGLASVLVIVAIQGRDSSPEFSRADFDAAQARWRSSETARYEIEVEVTGPQPAVYRAIVRGGAVVSATIDGRPLKQRRTLDTWSVPGMFDTMERDLANRELVAAGHATKETPRLTLRADFHPVYGYPQRYRRIEWGANRDMVWQVREFRPIVESSP